MGSPIPDSFVATNASGAVAKWNAGPEALFGYTAADAIEHNLDELLATRHPFGVDYLAEKLQRTGRGRARFIRRQPMGDQLEWRLTELATASPATVTSRIWNRAA